VRRVWIAIAAVPLFLLLVVGVSEVWARNELDHSEHYAAAMLIIAVLRYVSIAGIIIGAVAGWLALASHRRARSLLAVAAIVENAAFVLLFALIFFRLA